MCRILGIRNFSYHAHRALTEGFLELAEKGKVAEGDPPGHLDGWGIGYYRNGMPRVIKSGKPATGEATRINRLLKHAEHSPFFTFHLYKSAWNRRNTAKNAHPFKKGKYMLVHNGVIRDYRGLLRGIKAPGGILDTEALLYYLADSCSNGISFISAMNPVRNYYDYTSLNCIFFDGKKMHVLRQCRGNRGYYTLFRSDTGRSAVICSERIHGAGKWKPIDKGRCYAL